MSTWPMTPVSLTRHRALKKLRTPVHPMYVIVDT